MNTASLSELKKEIKALPKAELEAICLRLAKYKKENKELLHYLVFDASNENTYLDKVKKEQQELFAALNKYNTYALTKGLRKILRITNKYIKYSAQKTSEVELLLNFCFLLKKLGKNKSTVVAGIYDRSLAKIETSLGKLHEDIQFDYAEMLESLHQ